MPLLRRDGVEFALALLVECAPRLEAEALGLIVPVIIASGGDALPAIEQWLMAADSKDQALAATEAAIAVGDTVLIERALLLAASRAAESNPEVPPPAARFPALLARYSAFSDAAIKAITLIETRRIIDPRLIVFRTALSTVLHDTRKIIHGDFATWVMPNIPTDNPAGGIFTYQPPILSRSEKIGQLCDQVIDSLGDATAYAEDLLVALQNLLLGDLFPTLVPARQPIDPAKRAVTLDQADALETWFRTTTAWGREMAQIEADAVTRFAPQPEARA